MSLDVVMTEDQMSTLIFGSLQGAQKQSQGGHWCSGHSAIQPIQLKWVIVQVFAEYQLKT